MTTCLTAEILEKSPTQGVLQEILRAIMLRTTVVVHNGFVFSGREEARGLVVSPCPSASLGQLRLALQRTKQGLRNRADLSTALKRCFLACPPHALPLTYLGPFCRKQAGQRSTPRAKLPFITTEGGPNIRCEGKGNLHIFTDPKPNRTHGDTAAASHGI